MFKKLVIASALALAASASFAQTAPNVYAGVDFGTSDFDGLDGRESSYGAFAGYNFNQNFALEAGVRRIFDRDDVTGNQVALSGIAKMPLSNGWNIYGRLGYNRLSSEGEHESKVLYGAGVGYAFTPTIAGRLEVQKPHSDITNVSAGIVFQF